MRTNAFKAISATFFSACGLIALGGPAAAKENQDVSVEEALQICAAFADAEERFLCFEELAAAHAEKPSRTGSAGSAENDPAIEDIGDRVASGRKPSDKEPATAVAGDSDSKVALSRPLAEGETLTFVRQKKSERDREQRIQHTATVYRTWENARGEIRIAFTTGEIWRQVGEGMVHVPEPGEEVEFKPTLLGSWMATFEGGRYGIRMRPMD